MIGKIIMFPFWVVGKVLGACFGAVKLVAALVMGVVRLVFSHVIGSVFGATIGFLLGRKHVGIKVMSWKPKKKKPPRSA